MTAIVDYGVGNLFSLCRSLEAIGEEAVVTADPELLSAAPRIILPGVGAFGAGMGKLRRSGLDRVVTGLARAGKPLMGICLGMQLLFERSYEFGEHEGLGLLKGRVVPLEGAVTAGLKVPHMGWNALDIRRECPLLRYVKQGDHVYFVHSYHAVDCGDSLVADSEYGIPVTAAVARDNVMGCQFHPEKSGPVGLSILKAFCEME